MGGNDSRAIPIHSQTLHEASMAFKEDLDKGHLAEKSVLDFVRSKHPKSYRVAGNEPELDIIVAEESVGIEVKYDPRSLDTGNFVVEIHHSKPSGILVTRSEVWVFHDGINQHWINTSVLIDVVLKHCESTAIFKAGEDWHEKYVFLVPVDLIKQHSFGIRHDPIHEKPNSN